MNYPTGPGTSSPPRRRLWPLLILLLLAGVVWALPWLSGVRRGGQEEPVTVGSAAPDFRLRSAQGDTVALADYKERQEVLLYFSMGPG